MHLPYCFTVWSNLELPQHLVEELLSSITTFGATLELSQIDENKISIFNNCE